MNDKELHDAIVEGLVRRLDDCSVPMAARPYLVDAWEMGSDDPKIADPERLAAWTPMVTASMETLLGVLGEAPPIDSAKGKRFFAALLFTLELATRGEPAAPDTAAKILFGSLELDAALRELPPWRAEPDVEVNETMRATLAAASRLKYGDITVPLPIGAKPQWSSHPTYDDDGGSVWALFHVDGTVAEIHAFYRAWAQDEGWTAVERPADDILMAVTPPTVNVVNGTFRCGIFIRPKNQEVTCMIKLGRTSQELYDPAHTANYRQGDAELASQQP